MKKIYKILYIISIILVIIFGIMVYIDYSKYNPLINSAPFSAFILYRAFEFIFPSIIIFIITLILKKKYRK